MKTFIVLLGAGWLVVAGGSSCSISSMYSMQQRNKVYPFEQVNFHDVLKAYLAKTGAAKASSEGIYSVTRVVTKKGTGLFSTTEKERVIERNENYRQVAIIRDVKSQTRAFIEIPIENLLLPSYSIRGEFSDVGVNQVAVYTYLEKRGQSTSYSFTFDKDFDVLEGVRSEDKGNSTVIEKLTYLKLYPQ